MTGESNLHTLLGRLSPVRRPGEYVFVRARDSTPVEPADVLASVQEGEGLSLVVDRELADRLGLPYDFVAAWLTLQVHSALGAVGLTAAVASALAEVGISCNVIAGYHHDNLLVPSDQAEAALEALRELSQSHRVPLATRATLRRAGVPDAPAMAELARQAYAAYVGRIGREPAPMGADYASVVRTERAWVAELDGRIVGLLVLRFGADHLLLDNVAVSPEFQQLGIGKSLLDLAEQEARTAGLPEIRLYTNVAMTENLSFYPRRGYRETHRAVEDGYQRAFFTKPVTGD